MTGLDAAVPWSARLQVACTGWDAAAKKWCSFRPSGHLSDQHTLDFPAPDWLDRVATVGGTCFGDDPNYMPISVLIDDSLRTSGLLTIAVQPCASLQGRVAASQGKLRTATILAFALNDGVPRDPPLARCDTTAAETWCLRVPADVPLLIVANATFDPHWVAMEHLVNSLADAKAPIPLLRWSGFVPASVTAQGRRGVPATLPDLLLEPHSLATGVVVRNGSPVEAAQVTCRAANALATFGKGEFQWLEGGTVVAPATMLTDGQGAFSLPGPAGVAMQLAVTPTVPASRAREIVVVGPLRLPAATTVTLPP